MNYLLQAINHLERRGGDVASEAHGQYLEFMALANAQIAQAQALERIALTLEGLSLVPQLEAQLQAALATIEASVDRDLAQLQEAMAKSTADGQEGGSK